MTRRVTEHGPDKRAQGVWGVGDLRERPVPAGLSYYGDRAIEYLWAGPKLRWFINPPGDDLAEDFNSWTEDFTAPFGGYIHNGSGSQNDFCVFAAPLGPRWSTWHVDLAYARGPDFGRYHVEVMTKTMARRPGGFGLLDGGGYDTGSLRYDTALPEVLFSAGPYPPGVWDSSVANASGSAQDNWLADPGGFYQEGYDAGTNIQFQSEVGLSLRITGEYGENLSAIDEDAFSPHTGYSLNSGDGVMYYFRVIMKDKNASSSGYKGRIHGFRLSRALENDATLI